MAGARGAARLGGARRAPPRDLVLVDWADEEGARFGRSLFGSSALRRDARSRRASRELRDADGAARSRTCSPRTASSSSAAPRLRRRRDGLGAYLELHIEQGPRAGGARGMRAPRSPAASASSGIALRVHRPGVARRHDADGRCAATPGSPPPRPRSRSSASPGARRRGRDHRRAARSSPGIITAVAGRGELAVDLRHPDAGAAGADARRGAAPPARPRPQARALRAGGAPGLADRADPLRRRPGRAPRATPAPSVAGEPAERRQRRAPRRGRGGAA